MKSILRLLFYGFISFLVAFVLYTLISTGLFKTINSVPGTEVFQKIQLSGAEDFVISYEDSFAIISATDRSIFPAMEQEQGGLYLLDLKDESFNIKLLSGHLNIPFAPHGISMIKIDSAYQIMAINHTSDGDRIEVFSYAKGNLNYKETLSDPSMLSPNDLVLINENTFYFTNDHGFSEGIGKFLEEYLGLAAGNVVLYQDGKFREVANKIAYANGINYDSDRNLLFVASPRTFKINVYEQLADNSLQNITKIKCKTGIDNLEFDLDGNIWTGAHPNLLKFKSYSRNKSALSPSEVLKIRYDSSTSYTIEKVFADKGEIISASSVAAPFGDFILVGNVKDNEFLVLKKIYSETEK